MILAHLAVGAVAAAVTAASAPLVARAATKMGAVARPTDPPEVHRRPVPTLGGLAMLLGFLAAAVVAFFLPWFDPLFSTTSEPLALLVGAIVIVAIGVADDLVGLPPTVKLAGQMVAALGVAAFGIQLVHFWVPGLDGVIVLSPDLGLPLTILALVAMINAVNLIDGLDGLAAGVCAIAAIAFFAFAVGSEPSGLVESIPNSATLVAAAVAGMSLGFLAHNWHPAKLFMGDTGAMLLGLLLGAAGVTYVGRTVAPSNADFYGSIPLLVPVLVLAIPFADSAFAVLRRIIRRRPISLGDQGHLHHLLLAFGHSHRRAVAVLYYWSALLAFGSVGPAFLPLARLVPALIFAVAFGLGITALGVRSAPSAPVVTDPNAPALPAGPDVAGLDAADPDVADPDVADPDAADPDAAGLDAAGLDAAGLDVAGPDVAGPDTADRRAAGAHGDDRRGDDPDDLPSGGGRGSHVTTPGGTPHLDSTGRDDV